MSGTILALDKYRGDQVLGMKYEETSGDKRTAGLHI